jgi:DNA-directed RNA polymerase specialized sigma24 family protein
MCPIACDAWNRPVAPGSVEELYLLFLIEIRDPRSNAQRVWHLLVPHPWYVGILQRGIQWWVAGKRAWMQLAGDLFDTTVIVLREDLERRFDLWINPRLARDHFGGWLWRITHCQIGKAFERVSKEEGFEVPASPRGAISVEFLDPVELDRAVQADYFVVEYRLDIMSMLEAFDSRESELIRLRLQGHSLSEIADLLHITVDQVRYLSKANQTVGGNPRAGFARRTPRGSRDELFAHAILVRREG